MPIVRDEIERADVKSWLQRDVSAEIEDLRDAEITAEHTQDWYRGVLAWFAKYYVDDDPEQLIFADGSGDGGIDIASVTNSESETYIDIYQLSVPKIESIAEGRLVSTKTKFGSDVREARNTITGKSKKIKKLNATAQEVLRQINRARELATSGGSSGFGVVLSSLRSGPVQALGASSPAFRPFG